MTSPAPNYAATQSIDRGFPVVQLTDRTQGVDVTILPGFGNRVSAMNVNGKNIIHFPETDLASLPPNPGTSGIPFLAPWANRLSEQGFWANGKKYQFNPFLGNIRGALPIHGLISADARWRVVDVIANDVSAHVTSRFEFWKYPDLMAQWPFAHEYEMMHRLENGVLEVRVTVTNLCAEPMPVALGFHPYFQIPGVPRDEWIATIPARTIVITDEHLIPTGKMKPNDLPNPLPLAGHTLDTGFTDLVRAGDGRAYFAIEARGVKVETMFGAKYPVAVIWEPAAPPGETRDFICFEPMAGVTNAINLHHEGKYPELQRIPVGGKWSESFWVSARGL